MNTSRLFLALFLPILTANSLLAATFVVDDVGDASDAAAGNGTCATAGAVCTLRAAIEEANALAGADIIDFSIAGGGPHTISPGSDLPTINEALTIDGTTEPDYAVGSPVIEIDGGGVVGDGLYVAGNPSTIKALVINNCIDTGIFLEGPNTVVEGCILGLDVDGATIQANAIGIDIDATDATVGGTTVAARNVISGNTNEGINVQDQDNTIIGNYIGTDVTGTLNRGNNDGIAINGSGPVTIGGTTAGAGNVISGNTSNGLYLQGTDNVLIQGNYIGLNAAGTGGLGNDGFGIDVDASDNCTIGGTTASARNVISGHSGSSAIFIQSGSTGNIIQGNYLGTDVNGTAAIANGDYGVEIEESPSNTIGGTASGAGNLISGNSSGGVYIGGVPATGNLVQGNMIGTDANGTTALPNTSDGVKIDNGASTNTIGGTAAGAQNVISGNGASGVVVDGASSTGNAIEGNFIGTDVMVLRIWATLTTASIS